MILGNEINQISGCEFFKDKDLTTFTTFKLSARGDLVEVSTVEGLQILLALLKRHHKDFLVVGWGANQILPSTTDKIILHLKFPFDQSYLDSVRDQYVLPASLGLNHLTGHAVKFGLKGWEVFTGIPASLGGAIFMNAGTNLGEIGTVVTEVKLVDSDGKIRSEIITDKSFSYRKNHFVKQGEVIIEVTMKHLGLDQTLGQKIKSYLEYRKQTQPLTTKNCGCVFKNPMKEIPAGKLIDLLGLKSLSSGGLRISPKHANFMENTGTANWDHFRILVEAINFEMDHFYGIEFELEVKIPYH